MKATGYTLVVLSIQGRPFDYYAWHDAYTGARIRALVANALDKSRAHYYSTV